MLRHRASRNQSYKDVSEAYRQQSELIVQCARKCIEEKGVQKTTLVDIAREADMTRELIYYYFSGKQEILDNVFDSYVLDAVDTARLWCDTWLDPNAGDDEPLPREAIVDAVAAVRRFVFNAAGTRRSMFAILDETKRRQEVFSRMCTAIIRDLGSHPTARRVSATFAHQSERHKDIALIFYLLGAIATIDCSNEGDEAISDMVCATSGVIA